MLGAGDIMMNKIGMPHPKDLITIGEDKNKNI